MLLAIYEQLLAMHGPQRWWPVSGFTEPEEWEICIGAILTQNTAWRNAEQALLNLQRAGCAAPSDIVRMDIRALRRLVKPAGFYNQKAARLKLFSRFVLDVHGSAKAFLEQATRAELLRVNGIGPETADSILLYACGKPRFVIDAYTRRIFSRLGLISDTWSYDRIQALFEHGLPKRVPLYQEYHALIVAHAKACCTAQPNGQCALKAL